MEKQMTPERLAKGMESVSSITEQSQNDMLANNLNLGGKNLLSKGHLDWRHSNEGQLDNNKEFLVKSVVNSTPDKSAWDITKNWLARKIKNNKPESPANDKALKRTPVKKSPNKGLRSQGSMMSPSSKLSVVPKMGSAYYTDLKLQFKDDVTVDAQALKPWRRDTNYRRIRHPIKELKAQFDRIVSNLETKEATPIKRATMMESSGDRFIVNSPRRELFGRSSPSSGKKQNVRNTQNDILNQQNEGAWVKMGGMESHVASIRLDFNEDFLESVGEASSESRNIQRSQHVAEIPKPLSNDQLEVISAPESVEVKSLETLEIEIPLVNIPLEIEDTAPLVLESNTVTESNIVPATVNEGNNEPLEVYFTDNLSNIDYSSAEESFEEINPHQLQLISKRPSYTVEAPVVRSYSSHSFITKRPLATPPSRAVALVLHSGKPHFQLTQRYIMFREIHVPTMEINNFRFPPMVHSMEITRISPMAIESIESKTLPIISSALVPFQLGPLHSPMIPSRSYPMITTQLVTTHTDRVSRISIHKVDIAEHTTLVVVLFSTTIFMGYLSLLLMRRLMSAIALWHKRKASSYISRLEARAVECMVKGQFVKAVCLLDKGVQYISSRAGDTQLADCAGFRHLLGKALMSAGKYSAAEEPLRAVLVYYEDLTGEDIYLARVLEDLGMTLHSQGERQDEAYELLTKALRIFESEMMLAVIALDSLDSDSDVDAFCGTSYHAQVYSARLMGDAIASAEASYVPEASQVTQVPYNELFLSDSNAESNCERLECMRAVSELEAMLVPPMATLSQPIKMPDSACSIARRIDVARVRYEMGLVLESSEQLEDAYTIIDESLDVFLELSTDCNTEVYAKEKKVINYFVSMIEKKMADFQNMYAEEEGEEVTLNMEKKEVKGEREEKGEGKQVVDNIICDYEYDDVAENLHITPMKGEKGEEYSEKGDAGSPDTVMIF